MMGDVIEWVVGQAITIGGLLLSAWMVMVLFGSLHSQTGWPCNLSWGASLTVTLIVYFATLPGRIDEMTNR